MSKLLMWIVWLTFLLILCVLQSPRKLLTPQFVFVGCFIPQAIFATYFVEKWDIDLSIETMLILFSGTGLFFIASVIQRSGGALLRRNGMYIGKGSEQKKIFEKISIERWKLIVLLIVQIVAVAAVVLYIMQNVPGESLLLKIATINNANKFGTVDDRIAIPRILAWYRTFSALSCYVFGYIMAHSLILKYKQHNVLLGLNILLSLICQLTAGGRLQIIGFIISWFIEAYIIWGRANSWKKRIKFKTVFLVIIVGIIILFAFKPLAGLVGRSSTSKTIDVLGVYIAAPLKNLDTFIREGRYGNEVSNWQTLRILVDYLGRKLNIPTWVHQDDLPYRQVNGYGLGNVYTIFYCYLHDGGYLAFLIFILVQSIICQISFRKAVYGRQKHQINLHIVLYSYILQAVAYSFFGDRFYMSVISIQVIQALVCWWVLTLFLTKVKVAHATNNERATLAEKHTSGERMET